LTALLVAGAVGYGLGYWLHRSQRSLSKPRIGDAENTWSPLAAGIELGFCRGCDQGGQTGSTDLESILSAARAARLRLWLTEPNKWQAGGGAESEPPPPALVSYR
jgi:hypothetical protein